MGGGGLGEESGEESCADGDAAFVEVEPNFVDGAVDAAGDGGGAEPECRREFGLGAALEEVSDDGDGEGLG